MWWRRWSRLRRFGWLLIIAGIGLLAVVLPARALAADEAGFIRLVGWANILAFSAAVAGLVLMALDRRRPSPGVSRDAVVQAADVLAGQVLQQESRERARLLGTDAVSVTAANVSFDRVDRLVRFHEVGSSRTGNLDGVCGFYQNSTDGRLVILGAPGSGKTVLALELLVQLLEQRRDQTDDGERARLAVPVRFSLPAWNTDQPLKMWFANDLTARFGLADSVASALVAADRILPVLDGLDEMDHPDRPPHRAEAAVIQLNEYLAGRHGAPLVMTCRSGDYARIRDSLRPAVEVGIRALTGGQITDYLRREVRGRDDGRRWQTWQDVLDRLDDAHDRRLLTHLGTPWRLTLAVTLHRDGGDVRQLLPIPAEQPSPGQKPTTAQAEQYAARVGDLLLAAFVPGRTRLYGADRYTADQVTGWLRTIAAHLAWQADNGMSGSDIVLYRWWPIAGVDRVKRWHTVVATTTVINVFIGIGIVVNGGISAGIANVRYYLSTFPALPRAYLLAGLFFVVGITLLPYWVAQIARRPVEPAQINLQQLRTPRGRRQFVERLVGGLVLGLVAGLVLGLVAGLVLGLVAGLGAGLAGGLVAGLVVGLVAGLEPAGALAADPRDPIRNDVTVGLAAGLAVGLVAELVIGFEYGLVTGLEGGLAVGLFVGLLQGHAGLRYAVAVSLAARDRLLPMRFGAFLHWAYGAGILRISGDGYQLRHSELRDWLQQHDQPAPTVEHSSGISSPHAPKPQQSRRKVTSTDDPGARAEDGASADRQSSTGGERPA